MDDSWKRPNMMTLPLHWQLSSRGGKMDHIVSIVSNMHKRSGRWIQPQQILYIDDDYDNFLLGHKQGLIAALFPASYDVTSAERIFWQEMHAKFIHGSDFQIMCPAQDLSPNHRRSLVGDDDAASGGTLIRRCTLL